jgi:hypothetical protein
MGPHEILAQFKNAIRNPITFPGGYTKAMYMADGERICRSCARDCWREIVQSTLHGFKDGWSAMGVDVHWEGPAEMCDHCCAVLPSEYGDPDAAEEEDS